MITVYQPGHAPRNLERLTSLRAAQGAPEGDA